MSFTYFNKKIRTLEELEISEKSVFVRVDFNVPYENEKVADDTRIRAALPTLKYLLKMGAKITLASHLGRPKGKPNPKYSLLPVAERLAELIKREVILPDNCIGDGVRKILKERKSGEIVLLENLRFHSEEEANDPKFALQLKHDTTVYVTDAFGSLHRAHASTDLLARSYQERGTGYLVEKEIQHLNPLLGQPARPYAVLLGGVKISDKIKIIERFIRKVDSLYIGGAMVFTFLKAMGHRVGNSLVDEDRIENARQILTYAQEKKVQINLPNDFVLGKSLEDPGEPKVHADVDIPEGWMGLDIGPKTVDAYIDGLSKAKTIFWNGPMGLFEKLPYDQGTVQIAKALASMNSVRIIGGGDSVAAVEKAGVSDQMTHISTGGGATLEFLEGNPLPGLSSISV